jgi:hypothetical protein
MFSRSLFCALVVVFATPAGAGGAAPVLENVGRTVLNKPTASWTLTTGVIAEEIEISRRPETAEDGSFTYSFAWFPESLAAGQTSWVGSDLAPLRPGTYYVHVSGLDENTVTSEWSQTKALKIPNTRRPQLAKKRIGLVGHPPYGAGYYVTVEPTIRVCDDSKGFILIGVNERKWIGQNTFGRQQRTLKRKAPRAFGSACHAYRLKWRLPDKFFGIGNYGVTLRVRDLEYNWSRAVGRTWFTSD